MASAALALTFAFGATEARAVNLVTNGGFESPVISPPYLLDATPTGWTGTGDLVVQGYAGSVSSGDGNQWFDLNPDVSGGTGLSQDVSLVAGQTYAFSFIYNGGGGGTTTLISYNIGGDLSGSVSTAALNVYDGSPWHTLSTSFVSSVTGLETLHFMPNGVWSGGFIDNVQLTTAGVPEPASWALMIGGFGLAGAMLRRRRATLPASA
ncbi:MAG TPA: PEPxxWA-CTERM sorting domain-containing protein [Phenylobacterium sp.]|uniref:PEPxxWA-CTERM sorting domain-containing protein n=1 Tax=Phenylobacterium sp. TaxID=1871053 RepID=UPI002BB1CFDC|nr:PEPxxWA-CTERM sorting domain-containing protein [Phenylobacterium sp.]HXA39806.1 PEPxxWA-CTERM sorting domain-containing protein [Phenylobacterium sp.]